MKRRHSKTLMTTRHDIHDRSFTFACDIVGLYRNLVTSRTWQPVAVQLLRAGTGIGSNLQEASAGHSKADFIAKCSIARKEAFETRYWLRLLSACSIAPLEQVQPLVAEADELAAILTAIIKRARLSPHRR